MPHSKLGLVLAAALTLAGCGIYGKKSHHHHDGDEDDHPAGPSEPGQPTDAPRDTGPATKNGPGSATDTGPATDGAPVAEPVKIGPFTAAATGVTEAYSHRLMSADDAGNVYLATQLHLHHSSDAGRTFQKSAPLDNAGTISGLLAHHGKVLVAAEGGMYESTDHGKTYVRLTLTRPGKSNVLGTLRLQADGDRILAVENGAFLSTDGGRSFTTLAEKIDGKPILAAALQGDAFYASTGAALFVSRDLGRTWTKLNHPEWQIDFVTAANGRVYVGGMVGLGVIDGTAVTWLAGPLKRQGWYANVSGDGKVIAYAVWTLDHDQRRVNRIGLSADGGLNTTWVEQGDLALPPEVKAVHAALLTPTTVVVWSDAGVSVAPRQ